MICQEFKDATFDTDIFCFACGMDVGFEPVKISHKGVIRLYCCEDCTKEK